MNQNKFSTNVLNFLRMLLPEENFGTQFQHMMPFDTEFIKVNPGIHWDGIQTLYKNVFGSEIQVV